MMKKMISYAQNFEDVYLRRIFDGVDSGFYIDIGASDPKNLSVTKYFYDLGWSGINADPLELAYKKFQSERTRDINIKAAVTVNVGFQEFYEVLDYPELSTFSSELALSLEGSGHSIQKTTVNAVSGNYLIETYCREKTIDFMKIDVEGAEKDVITSIDFNKYRPKVLLVEATIPNALFPGWDGLEEIETHTAWEALILSADYSFAFFDGLNRYYIRNEDIQLLKYLRHPISHWDNFELAYSFERINELQWHCDERMKQINELTNALKFKII